MGPFAFDQSKIDYIHETFDQKKLDEGAKEWNSFWGSVQKQLAEGWQAQLAEAKKGLEEMTAANEKIAEIKLKSQKDTLQRGAETAIHGVRAGGALGTDAVSAVYQIRINLARNLAKAEDERIAKETNADEQRKLAAERDAVLEKAIGEAEAERERSLADLRQKDMRDFFEEMRTQAQTAGNILYNSLHSALDQMSDQLANLFTGQKTSFGKSIENVGHGMAREGIKSASSWGLGKLGERLGIKLPGKRGETPDSPMYVKEVGVKSPLADGKAGTLDGLNMLRGLEGDTSGGEGKSGSGGFFGTLLGLAGKFGGFMASGGDVDPGASYIVGEHEMEVFTPRTAGSITPASKLIGGGSPVFNVDARGADLGAANRLMRGLEASRHAAAAAAAAASAEHRVRTPQRSR